MNTQKIEVTARNLCNKAYDYPEVHDSSCLCGPITEALKLVADEARAEGAKSKEEELKDGLKWRYEMLEKAEARAEKAESSVQWLTEQNKKIADLHVHVFARAEKAEFELAEWKDRWFSTRPIIQERDDLKSDLAEARKRLGEAVESLDRLITVAGFYAYQPGSEEHNPNHKDLAKACDAAMEDMDKFLAQQEAPK